MTAYDFDDVTLSLGDCVRAIRAALDDEGLQLRDADNGPASRITSVLVDGVKRVIVPEHRIGPKYEQPRPRALRLVETSGRWCDACGMRHADDYTHVGSAET